MFFITKKKGGNVLFNDARSTFYLWLDHLDAKGKPAANGFSFWLAASDLF